MLGESLEREMDEINQTIDYQIIKLTLILSYIRNRDDHGFSPLHWAAKEGHLYIIQMLLNKGARVNATNMGDDTALHLAAAHGHRDCVQYIIKHNGDVNAQNEHGNTPLHYACFWNYQSIAELLIEHNSSVTICNKDNETPIDKCNGAELHEKLLRLAQEMNQDLQSKTFYKVNKNLNSVFKI